MVYVEFGRLRVRKHEGKKYHELPIKTVGKPLPFSILAATMYTDEKDGAKEHVVIREFGHDPIATYDAETHSLRDVKCALKKHTGIRGKLGIWQKSYCKGFQ